MLLKCSLDTKLPCAFVESGMALVWSFHWSPLLPRVCFCSLPRLPEQKGYVRLLLPFNRDSELEMAEQHMCMHIYRESNNYINVQMQFSVAAGHTRLCGGLYFIFFSWIGIKNMGAKICLNCSFWSNGGRYILCPYFDYILSSKLISDQKKTWIFFCFNWLK